MERVLPLPSFCLYNAKKARKRGEVLMVEDEAVRYYREEYK